MHIVILGCGRVGSMLAGELDRAGHSVAVVDQDAAAFRKLPADFGGITVKGIGFDRETLETAGIERAHAFAAVSSGDNSNILSARVARETYGVDRVVARIYDPRRAEIYQRLGIPTVATVAWTTSQIMRHLAPEPLEVEFRDPTGMVMLAEVRVHPDWIGTRVSSIEQAASARAAYVTRYGEALVPRNDTVLQEGDSLHLVFATADRERVLSIVGHAPEVTS